MHFTDNVHATWNMKMQKHKCFSFSFISFPVTDDWSDCYRGNADSVHWQPALTACTFLWCALISWWPVTSRLTSRSAEPEFGYRAGRHESVAFPGEDKAPAVQRYSGTGARAWSRVERLGPGKSSLYSRVGFTPRWVALLIVTMPFTRFFRYGKKSVYRVLDFLPLPVKVWRRLSRLLPDQEPIW